MKKADARPVETKIYQIIHTVLLSCIVLFGAGSFLGIAEPGVWHVQAAIVTLLLFFVLYFSKTKGRILCLTVSLSLVLAVCLRVGMATSLSFFKDYGGWLTGLYAYAENRALGYELVQTALIALGCCLLQLICEKYFPLMLGVAGLLGGGMIACLFAEIAIPRQGVAFLLCYLLLIFVEGIQYRWKKIRQRSVKEHMLYIIPFIAVYFLLLLCTPAPERPYDWKFVRETFQKVQESFIIFTRNIRFGNHEDFDMKFSGFSEDNELEGDIFSDNREFMKIQVDNPRVKSVYLTGSVYDEFDGRQWQHTGNEENRSRLLDAIELLYAVKRTESGYLPDYLRQATLHVRYNHFNSAYLFAPIKSTRYTQDKSNLFFSDLDGNLKFPSEKGYGTEYSVKYYQLNSGNELFRQLLEQPPTEDSEVLREILRDFRWNTEYHVDKEELERHRQDIYERYTTIQKLSPEVEEYLAEVTRGAESDVECLYRIEKALSAFTYTQSPGSLPETIRDEGDFLDYFLLESRQGYCTYFATAFALLARAEGFPARYVQGFCVPLSGNGETIVYSAMAHAWPEVYIDEVGWIPFEPTPGYENLRHESWKTKSNAVEITVPVNQEPEKVPVPSEQPEQLKEEEFAQEEEQDNLRTYADYLGKVLVVTFSSALALCAALLGVEKVLKRYRYKKMNLTEKFRAEIAENLKILSGLGLNRGGTETVAEFRERVIDSLMLEKSALSALENYEMLLYGEAEVTEGWIAETRAEKNSLLEMLKVRKRWAYFLYQLKE